MPMVPMALAERGPRNSPSPLPEKIAALVHEARWLVVGAAGVFLALVLWGFDITDPGWSHAAQVERIANPGGRLGAWLADLLFYLFGLSAWWWVAFLFFAVLRGSRRIGEFFGGDRRPFLIALTGFVVLLAASSGVEAMRFWSLKAQLPLAPGGMLGHEVGRLAATFLGYTGGTLILLTLMMAGLSLFSGISWLGVAERSGALLEGAWVGAVRLWDYWQDRRYGRALAEKREAVVESERRRAEASPPPPVKIEPVEIEIPRAPRIEARIEKERQAPLFFDAPGGALPPLHLLDAPSHKPEDLPAAETLEFTSRLIERKLADFGVEVKVASALPGPVVTRYEIEPATGVKGATIVGLAKDLARALSLVSIRVVETVPGKSCMALELPNPRRQVVRLSEIVGSKAYHDLHSPLAVALGKDIAGGPVVVDLAKMPHLLVAGTTGSGKSVGINAMILSLVYKSEPKDVRMIMVDPKMLELSIYEGIPHLLAPVVTDMNKAANALHWCVGEMERRYKLMSALGVRNLAGFNGKIRDAAKAGSHIANPFPLVPESPEPLQTMPYVVVVIDELADLMMVVGKKVEELIARLAQKARAAGIHLILATQRPSVDVITGLIKANIPTRIAFQVSSKIDSRTILDQMGAEALLGQGDMLYLAPGTGLPVRVHGAFVADDEVHHVVDHLRKVGKPEYIAEVLVAPAAEAGEGDLADADDAEADPMYDQAVEVVLKTRRPSISLVQRHLRIGYNRAARLIEAMERSGLVSPMNGAGNREVLAPAMAE
ncbi:MAG: DNA translocase FtsK 4TM domain-containing protein [Candidatus Nitricoxidivorans perseverans]|uniref:DNA translocase FtsK 4TM domain-containing protein n=1 Tax=Candidatus Nitricoxidivorans perseverans TaxID=2975601 RepID=A0AA49FM93_9PROT|nr:MAG: DNA translocase FtsK 4TM domain-containing protein [Candidatus Nitricoxidivorans perseverans]